MYILMVFTIISVSCFIILAMFNNGIGCFYAWACLLTSFAPWTTISGYMLFQSTIGIVQKVSQATTSSVELVGGWGVVIAYSVVLVISETLLAVGSFGAAIAMDNNDVPTAQKYWLAQCVGMFSFATFSGIFAMGSLNHAATFIENIAKNVQDHNNQGGSNSKDNKALQVSKRFRVSARNVLLALPTGSIICLLHCIFLPIFWYLAFIHCGNCLTSIIAVWFLYTPPSRRMKFLTCGILSRIDTSNNNNNNKDVDNNNSSPGNKISSKESFSNMNNINSSVVVVVSNQKQIISAVEVGGNNV
jgi:hypothetical protein